MTMDTTNRTEDRMDKDMKVLPVEGSELTYRVAGDGPPALLIHGGFGVIEVWDEIEADLATTHRVIAYDRRGHGRSPNGTPDMRVHARDAAELIQHVAEGPAIVVGWSGGASVAIETARSHADQVAAAIVVEPGFHFRPGGVLRPMLRAHLHWLRGRNRAAAETIGRTFFSRRSGGNGWDEIDDDHGELLLGDAEGLRVEVRPGPLCRYGGSLEHIKAKDIAGWSTPLTCLLGEDTLPALARPCVKLLWMSSGDLDGFGPGEPGVDAGLEGGVAGEAALDA